MSSLPIFYVYGEADVTAKVVSMSFKTVPVINFVSKLNALSRGGVE